MFSVSIPSVGDSFTKNSDEIAIQLTPEVIEYRQRNFKRETGVWSVHMNPLVFGYLIVDDTTHYKRSNVLTEWWGNCIANEFS